MIILRMGKNGRLFLLFLLWAWAYGTSSFGSSDSPFANPDKPPPKPNSQAGQLPAPIKYKPPVKQQPSHYELRGYYKFEGQWRIYLYHRNNREGAWLNWDENSTSVDYAGETFVFDTESKEVEHEGFQPIQLADTPKPTGKPFTPAPAKSSAPVPGKPKAPPGVHGRGRTPKLPGQPGKIPAPNLKRQ